MIVFDIYKPTRLLLTSFYRLIMFLTCDGSIWIQIWLLAQSCERSWYHKFENSNKYLVILIRIFSEQFKVSWTSVLTLAALICNSVPRYQLKDARRKYAQGKNIFELLSELSQPYLTLKYLSILSVTQKWKKMKFCLFIQFLNVQAHFLYFIIALSRPSYIIGLIKYNNFDYRRSFSLFYIIFGYFYNRQLGWTEKFSAMNCLRSTKLMIKILSVNFVFYLIFPHYNT